MLIILKMNYEVTKKDKQLIYSWKLQGINISDWNEAVKRYNELTIKDKQRIRSWKLQGINTKETDWPEVIKRYNNNTECDRCGKAFEYNNHMKRYNKVLEHDHNKVYNNIRGITCISCNSNLRHIDAGTMPDFYQNYLIKFNKK